MRIALVHDESGYTLLETMVAMSLFVGVLLPLVSLGSDFMVDRTVDSLEHALTVAETEMNRATTAGGESESGSREEGPLTIERKVVRDGSIEDVTVTVTSTGKAHRTLITLHKSVLVYK